jgi:hypothetical protein
VLRVIGGLPAGTPAAFDAAFGTGWLMELLEDYGFAPHLVHSQRCKAIASARLKNDQVDAARPGGLLPDPDRSLPTCSQPGHGTQPGRTGLLAARRPRGPSDSLRRSGQLGHVTDGPRRDSCASAVDPHAP